ncbi:MAG: TetR-like C-terminal domain-containing protein [Deltaproteobacteria bacterium]|nr:TetR-like C-terminal domain-containing protein [Deltaproteobacteria bacterium]
MDALTASGLAYVRFAQQHVGHFRVMFQHDLVDVFSDQQPLPEAERTFGVLMRVSQMAVHSGYGAGLTAIEIAHLCWSCVHGLANLLVEGVFDAQREAQRLGRADDRESSGDRGDEADARGQRSLSFEGNVVGRKIRRHHDGHRWRSAACRAERLRR